MEIEELDGRYAGVAAQTGSVSTAVAPQAIDGGMGFETTVASGAPTFIEAPYQPLGGPIEADVAVVGLPYEGTVQIDHRRKHLRGTAAPPDPTAIRPRPGAYDAPDAVRLGSLPYSLGYSGGELPEVGGIVIKDHLRVVDVGDADVRAGTMEGAWNSAAAAVAEVVAAGAVPMTIGGDHTITGMALAGIHAARPDLRIGAIVIDSHFDLADAPEIGASSFWYRTFRTGMLEPTNLCPIGIRGNKNPRVWGSIAEALETPFRTMADIDRDGIVEVVRQALTAVTTGVDGLYVSLDVDVIDPAFQPGQKLPDSAGLTAREVMLALRTLVAESPVPLVGFDVAEYSPYYDFRRHGAIMIARSIVEVIGGLAALKSIEPTAASTGRRPAS
jgi:agmatinase